MSRTRFLPMLAISALLLATPAAAQKVTGAIKGTITDRDGGVLPGATVILNSPDMIQKDLTTTTNHAGEYRFPLLDPGTYTVSAQMMGFQAREQGNIRLLLGQTLDIDLILDLEGMAAEITVSDTPIVDTQSTQIGTNFTEELLTTIPTGRSLTSVINLTPGATDGTVGGSTVRGNALQLDGVDVTDPIVGTQLGGFNFDNLEEVQIEKGGYKAEAGQVSGAIVNAVTKSGGNDFSGEGNIFWQGENLSSTNGTHITDRFENLTPNTIDNRIDTQGQLGGPISRDSIWFFGSYRWWNEDENVVGFPETTNHKQTFAYGKVTWQITPKNKFVGSINYSTRDRDGRGASSTVPPEATRFQETQTTTPNFEFTSVLTPTTYMQFRAAFVDNTLDFIPKNDLSLHFNLDTGRFEKSDGRIDLNERKRRQVIGSLSHFRDDMGGTHDFKFGFEYENSSGWRDFTAQNGLLYYTTGTEVSIPTYVFEVTDPASREAINRVSLYAQDTWTVADRLTMNLGLRLDHNKSKFPEQVAEDGSSIGEIKDVSNYTDLSPRAGVSFDLAGDGRSVARFSYARLVDANIIQYFNSINPNAIAGKLRAVCSGPLSFLCQPGEQFSSLVLSEFGASSTTIDDNFSSPQIDEWSIGVEHELRDNLAVAVNYIDKQERRLPEDVETRDFLPRVVIDRGDTLVDENGTVVRDIPGGEQFTLYTPDPNSPAQKVITNPDEAEREYRAIEFVMTKRMSSNWQLIGSFVISRSAGTIGTTFGDSTAISSAFDNPSWLINRFGNLDFHRPYVLKLTGAWQAPHGFNLSWHYEWRSGAPFSRFQRFTSGIDPNTGQEASITPAVTFLAEKQGSYRLNAQNDLNLSVTKEFQLGQGRLDLIFDVFNLFNIDTVTAVEQRSRGSIQFGDPLDFLGPRQFRVAARYVF